MVPLTRRWYTTARRVGSVGCVATTGSKSPSTGISEPASAALTRVSVGTTRSGPGTDVPTVGGEAAGPIPITGSTSGVGAAVGRRMGGDV